MSATSIPLNQPIVDTRSSEIAGHPKGLGPLFFTELWERFSYYGMRAILVLYMVAPAAQGGLGFDVKRATSIYGTYTMAVYITALPGGLAADYLFGACLLYTSDAADERSSVDLGGRRIIKKKKNKSGGVINKL